MSDAFLDTECSLCRAPATQRCSACRITFYCSFEHQRQHWKSHKRHCSPIIVPEEGPARGMHWVAGRDIKPGSSILKESPALRWPAWPRQHGSQFNRVPCMTCGRFLQYQTGEWRPCSACSWPVCSEECEEASIHKDNECFEFFSQHVTFPPPPGKDLSKMLEYTIALMRICKLKITDPKKYEDIVVLAEEPLIINDTKHLILFHEIIMRFPCFLNRPDHVPLTYIELRHAIWALKISRFCCSRESEVDCAGDGTEKHGMVCIYIQMSRLTKSCSPNCAHALSPMAPDFNMIVRAAVNIKHGEPITIVRRGGDAVPTARRQKELRQQFEFICQCKRCLDPTELNTYMSAMVCSSCRRVKGKGANLGYMLPLDPLSISDGAIWKCNVCNESVTAGEFLPGIYELADTINEDLDDLELFEEIIRVNSGKFLHPNHWVLQMAVSAILDYYQENGCPLEKIKHFTNLTLYRLNIEDVLTPGISYIRSTFQRDYLTAMWPIIEGRLMENPESARLQFREEISICGNFLYEALRYFELFRTSLFDGDISLSILTSVKASMEALVHSEDEAMRKMASLSMHEDRDKNNVNAMEMS